MSRVFRESVANRLGRERLNWPLRVPVCVCCSELRKRGTVRTRWSAHAGRDNIGGEGAAASLEEPAMPDTTSGGLELSALNPQYSADPDTPLAKLRVESPVFRDEQM